MSKKEKKEDPFAILDDPPGSWKPVLTLLFTLVGLIVFACAMAYMIWQVNTGRAILPGGVGGGN
jgi:hypothetical protein